jgi:hypothetical protein
MEKNSGASISAEKPAFQVAAECAVMTTKALMYFATQVPAGRSCDSRMVLPGNWYIAVGLSPWVSVTSI